MATAETVAPGLPVFGTRVCRLPEVVADGETAFWFAQDPEGVANAMIRLLTGSKLSQQRAEPVERG